MNLEGSAAWLTGSAFGSRTATDALRRIPKVRRLGLEFNAWVNERLKANLRAARGLA